MKEIKNLLKLNNTMKKILSILAICIFVASCVPETEEVLDYKDADPRIKDLENDPITYQRYMNERMELEYRYLTIRSDQQSRKSEYEKVKDSFDPEFRDHIMFADRRVPELNIAIEKIEEELQVLEQNILDYTQDLIALRKTINDNEFLMELKEEIMILEISAADLMQKRVDLFLQFRKAELLKEDSSIQSELNAFIQEAQRAAEKARVNMEK